MQSGTRQPLTEEVNPALCAALGRPATVLDVGCRAGVNGMAARERGARVTGIEHDPKLADRAGLLLDEVIRADPADLEAMRGALAGRHFDVVTLAAVLERAADPEALVRFYAEHVAPEGRLILSLRNPDAWPLRFKLEGPDIGYEQPARPGERMYTRAQAVAFARAAGLQVLQVDNNPMLLKAVRRVLDEDVYLSLKHGESTGTGFREFGIYQAYLKSVRPFEAKLAELSPRLLTYQTVVIARRRPAPRALSLTVGMLTMDEEPSIAKMIEEIRRHAPDAKILCVDSSVKDRTPLIAESLGARVLRQLPPRGHGPAMELLMYEAAKQGDALIYLDCDFTYPPELIPEIRRILESGADVVNAARTRRRPAAMPLANYAANKAFVWCARALDGVPISDLHSGMRGYRSSVVRAFDFDGTGDAIPIDTLLWPARCGYRVVEIPIEYQERVGVSKLRKVAGTVWTFIRLGKTLRVGRRRADTYEIWSDTEG